MEKNKKILSTTEEVNSLYDSLNKHIDEYIKEWEINPINLHKYFTNDSKVDNFLKKYKLDDIDNVKRAFFDVLEDRVHIMNDDIMTFESFKSINENIDIKDSGIGHERVLADKYNTSVGHIETVNSKYHIYEVNDFGDKKDVAIYSKEDFESVKKSLTEYVIKSTKDSVIEIEKFHFTGYMVDLNISIPTDIENLFNEEVLKKEVEETLDEKEIIKFLTKYISHGGSDFKYKGEYKSHYIWEK
jgi:hypothetical protein